MPLPRMLVRCKLYAHILYTCVFCISTECNLRLKVSFADVRKSNSLIACHRGAQGLRQDFLV